MTQTNNIYEHGGADYNLDLGDREGAMPISYMNILLPWNTPELEGWSIVGMNHYNVKGVKHLFCAMTNNGMCISYEGVDEAEVFNVLSKRAELMNREL